MRELEEYVADKRGTGKEIKAFLWVKLMTDADA